LRRNRHSDFEGLFGTSLLRSRHSIGRRQPIPAAPSRFGHGMGVRLALGSDEQACGEQHKGRGIMAYIVNEFLLFSCLAAFVVGVVVAAASLLI
jgi:hypothetical protein